MQQIEMVSGFTELKNILIKRYRIERPSIEVKLYFSEQTNLLQMHDYDNHHLFVTLSAAIDLKSAEDGIPYRARKLVEHALLQKYPARFLNLKFLLHGTFVT